MSLPHTSAVAITFSGAIRTRLICRVQLPLHFPSKRPGVQRQLLDKPGALRRALPVTAAHRACFISARHKPGAKHAEQMAQYFTDLRIGLGFCAEFPGPKANTSRQANRSVSV